MPITQDRMLALIAAAQDYEQAWEAVQDNYTGISQRLQSKHLTLEQAWAELDFMFTSRLHLSDPIKTTQTITTESTRFHLNKQRNIRAAESQRRKRAEQPSTYIRPKPVTRLEPRHRAKPEPDLIIKLTDTDAEQVSADTDLSLFEPANLSAEDKVRIDREVADRIAAEEYEAQYGPAAKPPNEQR